MTEHDLTQKKEQTPLDTKHLIWILGWARDHCAQAIENMELDIMRHTNWASSMAYTKLGRKERHMLVMNLDHRLLEHRAVYEWLDSACQQASQISAEEFGREMAVMFGKKGKK